MNKKLTLLIIFFVFLIIFFVCLIVFQQRRGDNYIAGLEKIIIDECGGREVTNEEYDKINPPKDLFYPFATVLTKKEYYDDGKCAIYMNYKQSQIDTFNKVKHDEVLKLFYYVESYFPDDNSNVGGSFAVEIREYSKDDIAKDKYLIESEKIHEYYKTIKKEDYTYDSKYNEKFYKGIEENNDYLIMCEYQKEANYITGNIINLNGLCVINIRFSFDNCDDYYNDLCYILEYMDIPRPKDIEMN
ncbi:MAG: hypothetical protein IJ065_01535 [Eubacterium sp.]|nr:hypothetical protein [Eubacterium sp.]